VVAFVIAALLQTGLSAQRRARDQRAAKFSADIGEMIIYSQRVQREYAPRLLDLIDRRIERFPEGEGISPHRRRQLSQVVQAERVKLQREIAAR
jgi:hypothetical protein